MRTEGYAAYGSATENTTIGRVKTLHVIDKIKLVTAFNGKP